MSVFQGRNGLQNTVFALLDPDGKPLTRGSRSPAMTFGSVDRFVTALRETSAEFSETAKPIQTLPVVRDLRLALNVAAADLRPLVVIRGQDADAASKLAQRLADDVAWTEPAVGRFHYVVISDDTTYGELTPELGVSVVQPDPYGTTGKVQAHAGVTATAENLAAVLADGLKAHDATDKHYEQHVSQGRKQGIRWQSETRSTDRKRKDRGADSERRRRRRDRGN